MNGIQLSSRVGKYVPILLGVFAAFGLTAAFFDAKVPDKFSVVIASLSIYIVLSIWFFIGLRNAKEIWFDNDNVYIVRPWFKDEKVIPFSDIIEVSQLTMVGLNSKTALKYKTKQRGEATLIFLRRGFDVSVFRKFKMQLGPGRFSNRRSI